MASIHSVINYQSQKPKLIVVPSANMPAAIQGDNGYTYYKLTTNAMYQNSSIYFQTVEALPNGLSIQILAIGGGGSGANANSGTSGKMTGGGGAGGLLFSTFDYTVSGNTFNFISVGAGGANTVGTSTVGKAGGTTSFSYSYTSTTYSIPGGGYGGYNGTATVGGGNGGNGACGGGGAPQSKIVSTNQGIGGTASMGYAGGTSYSNTLGSAVGAGGGGMGGPGVSGSASTVNACDGGPGVAPAAVSFLNSVSSTTFCVGGAGCSLASPYYIIGTVISNTYGSGGNANHNYSSAPTTATTGQDGVIYFAYKIK